MYLCIDVNLQSDDKMFYLLLGAGITFFGSLFVSWFIFYLTKENERERKIKEIKNNIVFVCDTLIHYAIHAEKCQASFRLHEMLYQKSKSPADEYEYRKFHEMALAALDRFENKKADMIKYLHELYLYDKNTAKQISTLFNSSTKYTIRDFIAGSQEINDMNYNELMEGIKDHILYKSMGIYLREIMNLLGLTTIKQSNASTP